MSHAITDGQSYAPRSPPQPVVKLGEFKFAATALEHGHIHGECGGLIAAGAELKWVYDRDPAKVTAFTKSFPHARAARSLDEILDDPEIRLVAAADIACERGPLGLRVMDAGKDYFTDKTPFTTLAQLDAARQKVSETGRKYMVYYSERLHNECAMLAGDLVERGLIGRVIHVMGLGPHRLNAKGRPPWFFKHEQYGGILCDIGSHQCEQFLTYAGARDADVKFAHARNYHHPEYPELEDFGEAAMIADNGASFYFRVDWFTPDGLRTWGDGRTFIQGTDGFIELRKYVDIGSSRMGDQLYLVNRDGERRIAAGGQVGFRFFGELVLDCLHRTEKAMTQAHAFKSAELCLKAQALATSGSTSAQQS